MKTTTSHSALKNKMFLGFWFILFAGAILFADWIFQIPIHRSDEIKKILTGTEKQIPKLSALHAEYLLVNDKEDNLFQSTAGNADTEIRQIITNTEKNIRELRSYNRVERKAGDELDEFSSSLTEFSDRINNLILITNERGNKTRGLISRWLSLSRNILNISASYSSEIRNRIDQIRILETEYLLNRDVKALQDLSILAEEIRNSVSLSENGISITDIDSYIVLTGNLVSIEKRMGHNESAGIIPDLQESIRQLPDDFTALNNSVLEIIERNLSVWNIVKWIMMLIITGLFILAFIRYFALVDPLKKISELSVSLAHGEFPDFTLNRTNHPDIKITVDSMMKHVDSLRAKYNFTEMLNHDKFDQTLTQSGKNDILGMELIKLKQKILENNERQAKNESENMVRRYINEGLAKFADILRSKNSDIHMLGDAFIREIVKYLNALQGGLFICDNSDTGAAELKLVSSFAYNRKKYLEQSVKMGEGLVGSCAREKQYVNITEIPKGYISITSGLGDTPPDNLLLVPVLHENDVLGVVEIASLNKFRKHEIDFAQEVAYNLGSTLVTTRNNQKTAELLEKSQHQALEMAEQEEEMRQNMEELKATQEESTRREEELNSFAEAVNSALMVIEYNLEGKIHYVNDNVCRFLGRDREEIIGKLHLEVFGGSLETDTVFWNELNQNGHLSVSEKVKIGRKSFDIDEHFAKITNRNNATVKYINFASDGRVGNS